MMSKAFFFSLPRVILLDFTKKKRKRKAMFLKIMFCNKDLRHTNNDYKE